jgi:hypothetical protein
LKILSTLLQNNVESDQNFNKYRKETIKVLKFEDKDVWATRFAEMFQHPYTASVD